jgi:PAS domain S-box-containing protein
MSEFFSKLFDMSDFPARWRCGNWSTSEGLLHIISDLLIWGAYFAIPLTLAYFISKRRDVPFSGLFWLFAAFIFSCGMVHLIDAIIFYYPVYRLAGFMKAITAIVSWATVLALVQMTPRMLSMPGLERINKKLETEIEERRKAEAALKQSEELFRLLANGTPAMIWLTDANGMLKFLNAQSHDFFGTDADEKAALWSQYLHPEDRQRCLILSQQSFAKGESFRTDCRILDAHNHYRWVMLNGVARVGGNGEPLGAIYTALDITDRHRTEEAIRRANLRYRSLVQATSQVVWVTNNNGECLDAESWCAFTGQTEQQASGLGWMDAVHPDDRPRMEGDTDSGFGTAKSYTSEYRLRRRDGGYAQVVDRAVPIYDKNGEVMEWVGTCTDVTELRAAEARQAELRAQMVQMQKLESLGVLAGGIAHDFNNLLGGIMGYASLALEELPADSTTAGLIEQVLALSQRASGLTRQMLAYAGQASTAPKPLEVGASIRTAQSLVAHGFGPNLQIAVEVEPDLPPILADPAQFDQVIMNLVTNAAEAIGNHRGQLKIAVTAYHHEGGPIADDYLGLNLDSGVYLSIAVSDTGSGISQSNIARIFDPFFSTKFQGRGLGLPVVIGILRAHRGAICIDTTPGTGTTFRTYWPTTSESPLTPPARPEPVVNSSPLAGAVILVVDDEEALRQIATRMLERDGAKVLAAADADEAAAVARSRALDAAVVDLTMPGRSGLELMQELRAMDPQLPILLSSGYHEESIQQILGKDHRTSFLQKPYAHGELRRAVARLLGKG